MDTSLLIDLNRKRSLERRRETSKHAARDRRGKEADIFLDLKDEVPVVDETTVTHVDRIALLRVASTMCRLRKRASSFLKFDASSELEPTEVWSENTLSECLDGFMLIADSDGTILYVTESVSIFLGLTQTDLVGRFLSEFVHHDDYDELTRSSMGDSSDDEAATGKIGHGTIVRIKTVISPRGRNLNLKSALYKATICRFRVVSTEFGQIWVLHASSSPAGQSSAIVMSNSPMRGSEATTRVFMTRHTSEMRFTYVSESLNLMLRHESRSLTGTSFYDLVYPADLPHVVTCMRELQQKGHCRTSFYRLIGANSSVTWVQTEATTVSHTTKGTKGHYVLCLHSILGTQSEMDSWTASLANSVSAARPVRRSVKAEIEDVSEYYFGLQPMVVECVDFEPLIEPTPQGYRPHDGPRRVSVARQSAEDLRADESGYEEVLQWLFRDGPDSPPPYAPALYRSENSEAASQGGRVQPMVYVGSRRQSDAASLSGNTYQRVGGTFRSPGPYGSPQSFRFSSAERAQYGSPAGMRSTEPSPRRYATLEDRVVGYGVRPAGAAPLDRDGRPLRGAVSLERRDAAALQRAQQFGGADLRQSQMAALQQRYRSESGGRAAGTASPLAEGLAQRRFVAGSPQGVPLAAAVHGAGRASRFDTHFQQRPLSRSVAAAAETVERSRSAHSNGRVVSAVQPSNAYVMSNLERGRAQPGRRTPSATLQPVVFVASPQALGRGYAARSISREGAYGRRTPSQTQRAEVYLPEQRYRGHEQSANCQPRQQQSVAALNVNQLPAAGMPATLPLRGMDIRQSVVPSPPDQGYSPPQKRQHLGYLPNDPYCTFDDEYCNMYQEGGEQYGAQLAPFIPQEDLFQLTDSLPTDLQNLFPEIEFSEFFAADVPPSKTQMMNPPVPMQSESMFPSEVFSIDDAGSFYDALAQQTAS